MWYYKIKEGGGSVWQVRRHGGRWNDQWRLVLETDDEQRARVKYQKIYEDMRQGKLELINPNGERVQYFWAPRNRLRSSW